MQLIKGTDGRAGAWALEKGSDGRIYISADDLGFWIEGALNLSDDAKPILLKHLYERIKEIAEKVIL